MRMHVILCLAMVATTARGGDWPTFRHDNRRSGATGERVAAESLRQQWVWQSANPPQPAWAGPAKWDAYANLQPLRAMRNYDPVFHPVAAGGSVFFGSSADDSVYCLDAKTGRVRWTFTTGGPVRIAPTVADGKVYFGSDDGYAYCLDAAGGRLLWKHRPVECKRRILNNGRLISLWPCRTGVLVDQSIAYFAAGMLPWHESYLCAVDAATGEPAGKRRYIKNLSGVTMEGALLASAEKLFSPQGRVPPRVFERATGNSLGAIDKKGGGGCFALITDDDHLLHGPGNKTGWISDSDAQTRQRLASFPGGNAMIVAAGTAYLLSDRQLAALDRRSRKPKWSKACDCPFSLILAGDVLLAGGQDRVVAFAAGDGKELWQQHVRGRAYGLAVADGQLLVATDEGYVYCFRPGSKAVPPKPAAAPSAVTESPRAETVDLAVGPYLQFTTPDSAVVRWQTKQPSPTMLRYTDGQTIGEIEGPAAKTEHEATLTGLRRNRVYHYTILAAADGQQVATREFECDTFFNYTRPVIAAEPSPFLSDTVKTAGEILAVGGVRDGICVVIGSGDGRLVHELARQSKLRVIGLETDAKLVAASREALKRAGVYGARVAVHRVDTLKELPIIGGFAGLVVVERADATPEGDRLLKPAGVRLARNGSGKWDRFEKPPIDGGVWSHQYGLADNSGYGGESLGGADGVDDLAVQWIGRPGPRAQADRNGRKPSPLSTGGRLFMQGLHRMIAIDAYNGTIVWSVELPHFERFNMPRDCSNWCADAQHVFAAIRDKCWQIDAADGKVAKFHDVVPGPNAQWKYDWGYVARDRGCIIGSAVKSGTSFIEFFGGAGAGWYDARAGKVTHKVCSDNLFALDQQTGKPKWTYTAGLIVNPTITISNGRIYFVECRNAQVVKSESRRVGMAELWQDQFLVAVDVATGRKLWEKPLDTADGLVVFYMAGADGKLVIVSCDTKYNVYAFDVQDGAPLWDVHFDWPGKDHGKHMSRPVIHRGKVFVRPKVIDLSGGKPLEVAMPGGGCGTYALTDKLVIFRAGNVTLWNADTNKTTAWPRLRPGCWLSTIPAAGMLLSPEAGGGCSCGNWLETSIGFAPVGQGSP